MSLVLSLALTSALLVSVLQETEPIGLRKVYKDIYDKESANFITEAEKSHDMPFARWRHKNSEGVLPVRT